MLAKYFSIIRNHVLSVSSQRDYISYHHNTLLDAFRTNSRSTIGRNPSMVIPLLANQDLTPTLYYITFCHTILILYNTHFFLVRISTFSLSFNIFNFSSVLSLRLLQHEKAATFLDILKSFFRPTLVRV